jgi:hypothetical protein
MERVPVLGQLSYPLEYGPVPWACEEMNLCVMAIDELVREFRETLRWPHLRRRAGTGMDHDPRSRRSHALQDLARAFAGDRVDAQARRMSLDWPEKLLQGFEIAGDNWLAVLESGDSKA